MKKTFNLETRTKEFGKSLAQALRSLIYVGGVALFGYILFVLLLQLENSNELLLSGPMICLYGIFIGFGIRVFIDKQLPNDVAVQVTDDDLIRRHVNDDVRKTLHDMKQENYELQVAFDDQADELEQVKEINVTLRKAKVHAQKQNEQTQRRLDALRRDNTELYNQVLELTARCNKLANACEHLKAHNTHLKGLLSQTDNVDASNISSVSSADTALSGEAKEQRNKEMFDILNEFEDDSPSGASQEAQMSTLPEELAGE